MPDREKVIKGLECCNYYGFHEDCPYDKKNPNDEQDTTCMMDLMRDALALLKEQKAKTGHWIDTTNTIGFPRCECSECNSEAGAIWMKYCPNCGAEMKGETEVEID